MNSHPTRLPELAAQVCAILERSGPSSSRFTRAQGEFRDDEALDRSRPSLAEVVHELSDAELESLLHRAAGGRAEFDRVITVAAGEAAKRSQRSLGHEGLAQRRGHRTAVQLVQSLTGESKGEAARQVRVGELIGETEAAERAARSGTTSGGADTDTGRNAESDADAGVPATVLPWQHPVTDAITAGAVSAESGHLIVRILEGVSASCPTEVRRAAAAELVAFACGHADEGILGRGILRDDLLRHARQVRDRIDVDGIEERYTQRYERRSLKTWRDSDGALNLHAVCDDESGVFLTQMLDLALSPRRGGPRFVSKEDAEWAQRMLDDPRSNEQLSFDTFMDIVRVGAGCDENTTFRTDRPGVRMITVVDSCSEVDGVDEAPIGQLEGSAFALPRGVVTTRACTDGVLPLTVDRSGRALNLGRTKRHFSAAQRIVLRARDGGCLWPGCDRPAWQAEAHHINEWEADNGRTDIADGVLLCRFHHLNLHNNGWRIRRRGTRYELIPPPGRGAGPARDEDLGRPRDHEPIPLHPKSSTWERVRQRTG